MTGDARLKRRRGSAPGEARQGRFGAGALVVLLIALGAWLVVLSQPTTGLPGPWIAWRRIGDFLQDLMGGGPGQTPAYQDVEKWRSVLRLAQDTVVMSVLALGLAGLGALATVGHAARSLTVGEFGRGGLVGWPVYLVARSVHVVARSVPDVVWALLVVFVVQPGILAGAIALALHELGVLGRLGSDVIDGLDQGPLRSLRAAGAGRAALVAYGVLPQALPRLVTLLLYRWEVVVRATAAVGFITAAGLGYQLRLSLSFRRWTEIALVL